MAESRSRLRGQETPLQPPFPADVQPLPRPAGRLHAGIGPGEGQVENQADLARERFFTPRLRIKSLDELKARLMDKCVAHAWAHRHPEQADKTIREMFEIERPQPVPCAGSFDDFHSLPASVSKTCTVRFDSDENQELIRGINFPKNKYPVISTAAGQPVEVDAYAERIIIRQGEP